MNYTTVFKRFHSILFFIALSGAALAPLHADQQKDDNFYTPKEDLEGLKENTEITEGLPNVLIIGDSISIGYTRDVIRNLKGIANVERIPKNAGDTNRGLRSIKTWLGNTKWDIIHLNWGLHDLCYRHPDAKTYGKRDKVNGTQSIPIAKYKENLEKLLLRLKETEATLIWASTTVVPEKEAGRIVGDEILYNKAAEEIMKKHGVIINDLHHLSSQNIELMTKPGDVHFTKEGYVVLAKQVSESIQTLLNSSSSE